MEWKVCRWCGERGDFHFTIEISTQICSPSLLCKLEICDQCLEQRGLDVDEIIEVASAGEPVAY